MEPTDKATNTVSGNGHAERTKQRAQTTAHDTVDRAARGVHDTVDRLADAATRATSSFGEKGEQFAETKERWMAQTRTYVQTHPVASIGIAVAAGFLLSRLLHSDSH
ncbi:MAG TPA: hypothetical protein VF275_00560 [Gammaproteobacteria bacterium]